MSDPIITVIGAGVAGLTTALALAERGARVEVVERSAALGLDACSQYAGGMLAPWCEGENTEKVVIELGLESLSYWPRVHPLTEQHGSLVVAQGRDAVELDRFARRSTHHQMIDAARIAALEPDLGGRFARGLFFAEEGHLDPRKALASLAARLAEHGVAIRFGVDGDGLSPDANVVDCRGLAARDRQADLRGVRGEMLHVYCPDISLRRPVRLLHPRIPLYIVPRGEGRFMIGATMVESDARGHASARAVVELLNGAYALHPAFADAEILEVGCDVRPAYLDNIPQVRRDNGRVYVNGLYRHGFLLSPAMARMAADLMLGAA